MNKVDFKKKYLKYKKKYLELKNGGVLLDKGNIGIMTKPINKENDNSNDTNIKGSEINYPKPRELKVLKKKLSNKR